MFSGLASFSWSVASIVKERLEGLLLLCFFHIMCTLTDEFPHFSTFIQAPPCNYLFYLLGYVEIGLHYAHNTRGRLQFISKQKFEDTLNIFDMYMTKYDKLIDDNEYGSNRNK